MKDTKISIILLALIAECCIIYASVLVKITAMSAINLGFYRVTLALPIFFVIAYYRSNIFLFSLRDVSFMLLAGIFFALDLLFFNLALRNTSVANVNLIAALVCFILVPIGEIFFHEKMKKSFLLGGIIAVCGVVILIKGRGIDSNASIYGDFLALLSVLCYGLFLALIYKLRRKYGTMEIMFFACFGSSITLFVLALCIEGFQIPQNCDEWWLVILIAFFGQVVGQGFFNYIMGKANTQTSSLLLLFSPAIAALMGFLLLGEKLGFFEIIGIIIIMIGVYFAKRQAY